LAGQPPQEPPWQPQGQDDGRQSWQAYSPPSAADGQETYAYPQSGAAPAPGYGQGYAQDRAAFAPPAPETRMEPVITEHDQVYRGADQTYIGADQSYAGTDQSYAGTDPSYAGTDPSYTRVDQPYTGVDQPYTGPSGAPGQDQAAPQWQSQAASQWKAAKGQGPAKATSASKGFVSTLFDFSFTSFVTPKIVKALYVLVAIWTVILALIFLRLGFKYGGAAGGFFTLIVVVPVFGLLTLGAYRMLLEFFMVVHRIHDELKAIREQSDNRL
jgi:Domain of unknown function (DUF4282)